MVQEHRKASSAWPIVIAIVMFSLLLIGTAIVEEVVIGTHYVASLYRTPIDWLIETVAGLF